MTEESVFGAFASLVFGGFIFWIIAPEFNPLLPFDVRLFAILCWGSAALIVIAGGAALGSRVFGTLSGGR